MEVMEQYQLNISKSSVFLDNRDDRGHVHRAWEICVGETLMSSVKEGAGQQERKENEKYFDEVFSKIMNQRKRAKLLWLQDQSRINADNLNFVKHEASRYFRNKSENI